MDSPATVAAAARAGVRDVLVDVDVDVDVGLPRCGCDPGDAGRRAAEAAARAAGRDGRAAADELGSGP
ncbi:MAG: hypothetical protein ACYCU7_06265 [Acidimicrobiales bacterium]